MSKHMYMKITRDKYELPIAIADSTKELAVLVNTTPTAIASDIYYKRGNFVRVDFEEELKDE